MSIQSEINRISKNISDSLAVIISEGIAVSADANSDDLPALIQALAFRDIDCGLFSETNDASTDCGTF